jgi:geranylgeranyl pyrophosphate synthase
VTEVLEENKVNFLDYLKSFSKKFDKFYNQKYFIKNTPKYLKDSIYYINSTGGKRIRPFLVHECANYLK